MFVTAVIAILAGTPAHAGSTINVASMTVNGLEARNLSCTLQKGGLLAPATIMGALSAKKEALDACSPKGAAIDVTFDWTTATGKTTATAGGDDKTHTCVQTALSVPAPVTGTCTATILIGDQAAASAAADARAAKPASE